MNSPFYRKPQIEPEIVQQCGQANFNGSKLAKTVLPIPPLSEQNQIVVKVKEIMKLVDQLEMKENEAIISGENLLESLAEKLI